MYVTPFAQPSDRRVVSRGGGHSPRWRADGRELFYVAGDGTLVAVPITDDGVSGEPSPLFRVPGSAANSDATGRRLAMQWDVASDGTRFLFTVPTGGGTAPAFNFVQNWHAVLRDRADTVTGR